MIPESVLEPPTPRPSKPRWRAFIPAMIGFALGAVLVAITGWEYAAVGLVVWLVVVLAWEAWRKA